MDHLTLLRMALNTITAMCSQIVGFIQHQDTGLASESRCLSLSSWADGGFFMGSSS